MAAASLWSWLSCALKGGVNQAVVGEKFAISCAGCGVCSPAGRPEEQLGLPLLLWQQAETCLGSRLCRALSSTTRDRCRPWPQLLSGGSWITGR